MMKSKCNIAKCICMILAALMGVLSACAFYDESAGDKDAVSFVEDSAVNDINNESLVNSEVLSSSVEESYKTVLLENGDFVSFDLQNRNLNLSDIKDVVTDDDSITVTIPQFAIIDLDNDGESEVVLWIQINGISDYGFEILRYQEGTVYGYTLPYMAFMNLKVDGTFLFSDGAADFGIGTLKFSESGYVVDRLYYSESKYDSDNELSVQYVANGDICSEEEFNHIVGSQEEKSNVNWYGFTDDNVNSVFENMF
ncbi:MAG: hypothetical protein HDQ99_14895 [Lachnospiraceae bacterium]|nr:hypothetical protein [Lachnospiraceae bacterium]